MGIVISIGAINAVRMLNVAPGAEFGGRIDKSWLPDEKRRGIDKSKVTVNVETLLIARHSPVLDGSLKFLGHHADR